jgi:chromosome segregation ATPase
MITLGGNAELELVDSMDPFSEGIIFSVMPPKKSWRNISNLSGGEKVSHSVFFYILAFYRCFVIDTQLLGTRLRTACLQGV